MNDSSLFLFTLIILSNQSPSNEKRTFFRCLNSTTHKIYPSYENNLFDQCAVWKNMSCCKDFISVRAHFLNASQNRLYNFNYNHCPERSLSDQCRKFFIDDLCFYQCSPYNHPWIINAPMKIRQERFYKVPLCRSDCNAWFEACQYDYTCSDNWVKHFIWNETGNECLKEIPCATFTDIFGYATNFCEKVWDNSWKVVDDRNPCMKLRLPEHNKLVGMHYAKKLGLLGSAASKMTQSCLLYYIIFYQFIYFILKIN